MRYLIKCNIWIQCNPNLIEWRCANL